MFNYQNQIDAAATLINQNGSSWGAISPESAARMKLQNRFKTGLDIARYTANIMRKDMADYDADSSQYTQSLGCWHGFIGQQKMLAVKKHHGPLLAVVVAAKSLWRCIAEQSVGSNSLHLMLLLDEALVT